MMLAYTTSELTSIFTMQGFAGLSLFSVLLLMALGLAIIFGQMGVINMAHGEFMASGAYTVYLCSMLTAKYAVVNPIFQPSPVEPRYTNHLIFEGISVDEDGKQYYLDVHIAYRRACLNAIEYLKKFGYTGEQAYAILGTAPVEGHISGIVDIPNACATVFIPTEIFDIDITPCAAGPKKMIKGKADLAVCK